MDGAAARKLILLVLSGLLCGCSTMPAELNAFATMHTQVLMVEAIPRTVQARVTLWEQHNGRWSRRLPALAAVVGRHGVAAIGEKKEGDGQTPAGTFDLVRAFGSEPHLSTGLNYTAVSSKDIWVDDPLSDQYNQWGQLPTQANSYEQLLRPDGLYRMAAVIEYNTNPVIAGAGSAIFLHIWRRYDHATAGCVALSRRNVRRILQRLDATKHPVILIKKGPYGY